MPENIDWKPLGNDTIRKSSLYYPLEWNSTINIGISSTCVSKYGGLIAVIQGDPHASKRPEIVVYNAAGMEISSFKWNSGPLIGISWTHADDLLCIQEDGQILLYNVFCQYQKTFTMGKDCRDNKVVEFEVFLSQLGTGIAVMNGVFRFLIVNNIDEPKPRLLADVPGLRSTPPSCWCVLPSSRSSRILAANNEDLYLLEIGDQCHQQLPSELNVNFNSFIAISVSLDGKHVALFTDTGLLWIGSTDFQIKYCEFNTGNGSRPTQLLWCCESVPSNSNTKSNLLQQIAVVVYRPGNILLISPKKDWVKYDLDENLAMLSMDVDGIHVVTPTEHSLIQHVPKSIVNIFRVGSMEPGALLYDAENEFKQGSEKADEYLRMLVEEQKLESAVEQCLDAAFHNLNPSVQKQLLKASSFGKSFLTNEKLTEMFVETCKVLRILNAVRDPKVGYFLTATQFQHLTVEVLIDRLVHRRLFYLSFQICKYLKFSSDRGASRILSHWACYKVQLTNLSDDHVASAIQSRLKFAVGVSYASIAEQAVACGRKDLAVKLLDFESRPSEQVRMLSKLGKHQLALDKAVLSGNTDLTYSALSSLRERSGLSEFLVAIRQKPIAYKLHLKFCRKENERMLKDLYEQEDHFIDLAYCHIKEGMGTFRSDERSFSLHAALDCFNKARDEFQSKTTEDQIALLLEQDSLEQEFNGNFVEISLHDTLQKLLLNKHLKKAEQLRKQFKVTDKRWWWLRVSTLAELRCFHELDAFAKSKKSPIGYLPFVEECLRHSSPDEAAKYLGKVAADKRVAALLKIGNLTKAAELATQTRNISDLNMVVKNCGSEHRELAERLRAVIAHSLRK